MSVLADFELRTLIENGSLGFGPWDARRIQPASIDLTLGETVWIPRTQEAVQLTAKVEQLGDPVNIIQHGFIVRPGDFVLAATMEDVCIPVQFAGRVEGKSSLGRWGLIVHTTAGWIDPGFQGNITLEIKNLGPTALRIDTGMAIGQLTLMTLTSVPTKPYNGAYQGSRGVVSSRYRP